MKTLFILNINYILTLLVIATSSISYSQTNNSEIKTNITENELLSEIINLQKKVEILVKDETNNIELLTQDYLGKLNTNCPNIPVKDFYHIAQEKHTSG